MGVSRSKAAENRRVIVEAATRLFRRHGIDAVGVSELMREAGFTHGGFYNHFPSKDALVAEAMSQAMAETRRNLENGVFLPRDQGGSILSQQLNAYLEFAYSDLPGEGCAVANFVGESKHMGGDAREAYTTGVAETITRVMDLLEPDRTDGHSRRERAIAILCEFVGTLALARAVVDTDRHLADEIIGAGRRDLLASLEPRDAASA